MLFINCPRSKVSYKVKQTSCVHAPLKRFRGKRQHTLLKQIIDAPVFKHSNAIIQLKTIEINPGNNYLSAGDIPLPKVYAGSALAYFVASGLWAYMLLKKDTKVFWPHKLMYVASIQGYNCRVFGKP